ncbi:MAG: hypothetical protein KBA51_08380 [Kiritimatiellae bacterium]|nr:hypothetical protein [Kiritimatiellia bacterium]
MLRKFIRFRPSRKAERREEPAVKRAFIPGWARRGWLPLALVLHIAAALGYRWAVPLFDWPDEVAHFNNIRYLAEQGRLDVMSDAAWDPARLEELKSRHFLTLRGPEDPAAAGLRYQAWQPPLYYTAGAGVYRLTRSVDALRGMNLLFSCLALGLAHAILRAVFPGRDDIADAGVLFMALHPMRAFLAVSLGNDPASEALWALGLWLIVTRRPAWWVGLAAGAGLLTKVHLGALLPGYAVWRILDPARGSTLRERGRGAARDALHAAGLCLLVATPWLIRNMRIYGATDPLALGAGALGSASAEIAAYGRTRSTLTWTGSHGLIEFFRILSVSWWGVYGWMNLWPPRLVQGLYAALTAVPLVGAGFAVMRRARHGPERHEPPAVAAIPPSAWMIALTPLVFLTALLAYSRSDFQPQGRYLWVAGPAWGMLFALGWNAWPRPVRPFVIGGSLLLMILINAHAVGAMIPWYLNQVNP